jgi:YesN/AraC family two-component response regulator
MLKHVKNINSYSFDGVSKIWFSPYNQYYHRTIYKDIQPELASTLPLHLDFVNDEHCFEKYYRRRKAAELFSIELVLEGSMIFVQDGKKYHVKEKSLFLIHYDHDCEFTTGPEKHCHRLACSIGGHELNSLLNTTKLIEHDVIKLGNFTKVKDIILKCKDELKEKKTGFRRRGSVLSYELLLALEENLQQINTPRLLTKAVDLMEHHLSQPLTLKKMATALNSAPTSLNRLFKNHFGTSPIDYFINLKMKAAKSMLINTNLQIQEIAFRTGYSNALYFSSEFKKRTGLSPREFRKTAPDSRQML